MTSGRDCSWSCGRRTGEAAHDFVRQTYRRHLPSPRRLRERRRLRLSRGVQRSEAELRANSQGRHRRAGSRRGGAWAQIDEKTGEVTFALGALGSGKPLSVRNTETRLLGALRYEFGDRVEVFATASRCDDGRDSSTAFLTR